jgi:hypothetical protein
VEQNTTELKIALLQLLEERKRRQEIEMARRAGAIVVDNRDGSVTVIRLKFVKAINGKPAECAN